MTCEKTEKKNDDDLHESYDDDDDDDQQMFGKNWKEEEMVYLCNNVYIKKRASGIACNGSKKAAHLLRRQLEGVFKPEALLKCTLTGQSPKAQGKERLAGKYCCLNINGKKNIKSFA